MEKRELGSFYPLGSIYEGARKDAWNSSPATSNSSANSDGIGGRRSTCAQTEDSILAHERLCSDINGTMDRKTSSIVFEKARFPALAYRRLSCKTGGKVSKSKLSAWFRIVYL
jgi:hypothetical protein